MNNLEIGYGAPKSRRVANAILGAYLLGFSLYILISEYFASRPGALIYASIVAAVFAAILFFRNTLISPNKWVTINSETIDINIPEQKKRSVEWVNVSKINIGVSYIIFFVNGGQKQCNLDLSTLKYSDVALVKSKIIELSEFKNISYTND